MDTITQKPANNRLHTDLAGFSRQIWIIGIPKLVLIQKVISSHRQAGEAERWGARWRDMHEISSIITLSGKKMMLGRVKLYAITLFMMILCGCNRETTSPTPKITVIENTSASANISTPFLLLLTETREPTFNLPPTFTSTITLPSSPTADVVASTPLPPFTLTPTFTNAPPSETPTITPTPMALPITQAISQCVPLEPELPPGFLSPGNIVISKYDISFGEDLLAISANDFQPRLFGESLPPPGDAEGKVSPDGQLFLYEKGIKRSTYDVVISSSGEMIATLPFCGPARWLDNDRIACAYLRGSQLHVDVANPLVSDQYQGNTYDLPNVYRTSEDLPGFAPQIDSTLTRVIYPQVDANGKEVAALWDLQKNQTLWSIESIGYRYAPKWSPDGSLLAIDNDDSDDRYELFLVNRDGQAQQWLELSGYRQPSAQLTWSPNGRYLAITLDYLIDDFTVGHLLYVLDIQARSLVEYCGLLSSEYMTPHDVYWSPDSKQIIAIQWVDMPYSKPLQTVNFVLDIENRKAARLEIEGMPDALILGWLVNPNVP